MTKKAHLGKMNAGPRRQPFDYQEFKREKFREKAWVWFMNQIRAPEEAAVQP